MFWKSKSRAEQPWLHRPRAAARFSTPGIECDKGAVQDMSETGIRIRGAGKPEITLGHVVTLAITTGTQRLSVSAQVMWLRKEGWKAWEAGLHFTNMRPPLRVALRQIAQHGFVNTSTTVHEPDPPKTAPDIHVEDLYAILAVGPGATEAQIHAAYRALAKQWHPDRNKAPDAADRFATISKAYSVLRDATLRGRYDLLRRRAAA